jgi:hypothetical protein
VIARRRSQPRAAPRAPGGAPLTVILRVFIVAICATVWLPLSVPISGLNIRASLIILPFALVLALNRSVRGVGRRLAVLGFWAGTMIGADLLWTVVRNPGIEAIGHVTLLGLNVVHLLVLVVLLDSARRTEMAVDAFLWCVAIFNGLFALIVVAHWAGVPWSFGVLVEGDQVAMVDGQVGSEFLARFAVGGVLSGCLSAASLLIQLSRRQRGDRASWQWWIQSVLIGTGMVIGFSRQAVLSLLGGFMVMTFYWVRMGMIRTASRGLATSVVVLGIVYAAMGVVPGAEVYRRALVGRLMVLPGSAGDGTGRDRQDMWTAMAGDVSDHPLSGSGQDSYMKYFPTSTGQGSHNFALEMWHAGGLLAFIGYVLLHVAPLRWANQALRKSGSDRRHRAEILGLVGAYVVVVTASLTNLIYWNPTYWLILALLVAVTRPLLDRGQTRHHPVGAWARIASSRTLSRPAAQSTV